MSAWGWVTSLRPRPFLGNILGNWPEVVLSESELPRMAAIDTLTDKAIKKALKEAATSGKPKRVSDGGGLYLEARPTGAGWWRLRYFVGGKEGMLSLGTYPDVSLKSARVKRNEAREMVAAGGDPSAARKVEKVEHARQRDAQALADAGLPGPGTFENTAREWHEYSKAQWSPRHAVKVLALLENDLLPFIGARPLADIAADCGFASQQHMTQLMSRRLGLTPLQWRSARPCTSRYSQALKTM